MSWLGGGGGGGGGVVADQGGGKGGGFGGGFGGGGFQGRAALGAAASMVAWLAASAVAGFGGFRGVGLAGEFRWA